MNSAWRCPDGCVPVSETRCKAAGLDMRRSRSGGGAIGGDMRWCSGGRSSSRCELWCRTPSWRKPATRTLPERSSASPAGGAVTTRALPQRCNVNAATPLLGAELSLAVISHSAGGCVSGVPSGSAGDVLSSGLQSPPGLEGRGACEAGALR